MAGPRWIALAVNAELSPGPEPAEPSQLQQTHRSLTTDRLTTLHINHFAIHPPYPSPIPLSRKGRGAPEGRTLSAPLDAVQG
jgi:hypothetical protein